MTLGSPGAAAVVVMVCVTVVGCVTVRVSVCVIVVVVDCVIVTVAGAPGAIVVVTVCVVVVVSTLVTVDVTGATVAACQYPTPATIARIMTRIMSAASSLVIAEQLLHFNLHPVII
jgi:hypothetical protein